MKPTKVILKNGRDISIRRKHPWIFSGAIQRQEGDKQAGNIAQVVSAEGDILGSGYLSDEGSIAVKMLTFSAEKIDDDFWQRKIKAAVTLRQKLGLLNSKSTTAFRLVNAEGDGLPGLIVDLYGKVAVLQCQTQGMRLRKEIICARLRDELGPRLEAIFDRSHASGANKDEASADFLWGTSEQQPVSEHGWKFLIDWQKGQKTGFFLDQRDNRRLVQEYAFGRTVLNAFCYTGGFSVYALGGGAKSVESVDSSQPALRLLKENIALNFENAEHGEVAEDYLRYMQEMNGRFDLIILDPPAFAKQRAAISSGLRGYRSINSRALEAIKPGGFLFTFSCSQLVTPDDFRRTVFEAALHAKREVRVLRSLHQAACHPVSIGHPEGEYLKGLLLYVE